MVMVKITETFAGRGGIPIDGLPSKTILFWLIVFAGAFLRSYTSVLLLGWMLYGVNMSVPLKFSTYTSWFYMACFAAYFCLTLSECRSYAKDFVDEYQLLLCNCFLFSLRLVDFHAVIWMWTMQGMEYLHRSPLRVHGVLRSSNCLLNYRWTLKISDYGLTAYRVKTYSTEYEKYAGLSMFWILSVISSN